MILPHDGGRRNVRMISLEPYDDSVRDEWDYFVRNRALNSGFMQSRNFIDYHPEGRFTDCSLIFRTRNSRITAVIPACSVIDEDRRTFFSHRGCTYGGIAVEKRYHSTGRLQEILDSLNEYLTAQEFRRAVFKLPGGLYTGTGSELSEYMFGLNGYSSYAELNSYIDFSRYNPDILSNFSTAKRTHVRNGKKAGWEFRLATEDADVADFYRLLTENLKKYQTVPVHSLAELLNFKNSRLTDIVRFYGVFIKERMLAGGMVYDYPEAGTVYTTYLSADPEYLNPSPATFLYYGIIADTMTRGRRYLSFGISTEEHGSRLNRGLIHSKESFGSLYSIHRTVYKNL